MKLSKKKLKAILSEEIQKFKNIKRSEKLLKTIEEQIDNNKENLEEDKK